ncbi:amidohydrolase [Streptomyces sp. RS10V-4]|uniref:amidohydrolase n=1 Tax=Streptomyces rhizoryzae TaxID=2932493 RepID=UPI0020035EC4|nr:amidohydrolase [Streptomyces rhizoryzae]MCK7621974.1 amidohydrolase [Streptomyces rhizoryzae]
MDTLPPLIDQHSHGAGHGELGLGSFEAQLAAATGAHGPAPAGTSHFDTRTGLAIRRWCPPLLGLEPSCPPVRYLARRRELGAFHAQRRLLGGAGIGTFLVEAGAPASLTSAGELAAAAGARAYEIVRLEPLAEQVADTSGSVAAFLGYTAEALYSAAQHATAFASGAAFCDGRAPEAGEVRRAADRWLRGRRPGDRLAEPALVRHLLWSAVATGLPVQLHCADPQPLAPFLRATAGLGCDLVLLPAAPYHRRAARFAAVHAHVYADAGPFPEETLARAPFGKLLFSSGARGLPELYVAAARLFARGLARVVGEWTAEGLCGAADGRRITELVGSGTARRVYRLAAGAS